MSDTTKKLYRVTAKGFRTLVYYVVSADMSEAEKAVREFHRDMQYWDVEHCDVETLADSYKYGKPHNLLLP